MGKHIGNFKHPESGNTCYVDVDMLKHISLAKADVAVAGQRSSLAINYELTYNSNTDQIELKGTLKQADKTIKSQAYPIDSFKFAQLLFDIIVKDDEENYIDNHALVSEPKEKARVEIVSSLLSENILLLNSTYYGFGFIKVGGDKVITIDKFHIKRDMVNNYTEMVIELKNCCGIAELAKLEEPSAEFYTNGKLFNIASFKVVDTQEGRLKQYNVQTGNIDITDAQLPAEYADIAASPIDNSKTNDDMYLDAATSVRISLLDEENEVSNLESMFEGLF
jgi:hypothetical protein